MRKATKNPNARFPRKLSRVMLMRAENGKGRWQDVLRTLHRETLYDRIRRVEGKPLFSFTGKVADEIIISLLTLYERLLPRLDFTGVSKPEAMWSLVENVFVPTVFIKLVAEWQYGLGTEFQAETCWYLPVKADGRTVKPIARVLDCWLRVAGFRTAYGVSHNLGRSKPTKRALDERTEKLWKAWKKSVERWLSGKPVQSVQSLHRLVGAFAKNVSWLDDSDNWRARFTLAFGVQNVCDAMDDSFSAVCGDSSLMLADMLRRISDERLVCDDDKLLAGSHSFFAARLFQRRLQKEGEWEKAVGSAPKSMSRSFPPEASDEEIATFQRQMDWQMNPGNWFLQFIKDRAFSDGRLKRKKHSAEDFAALEAYIFEIGVAELNRLLASKRKEAGER